MAQTACKYKYSLELEYVKKSGSGTKSEKIDPLFVTNMVVDYDYENLNMPTIYLTATLDKRFIDDMIKNINTGLINLTVYKFIDGSATTARTVYFRDQFVYFMADSLNENDSLDYSGNNASRKDIRKTTIIGLMSVTNMNDNKHTINNVISSATMINIIHLGTKHIKDMLIEPLDYNPKLNSITVPPRTTVSGLIKFLNDIRVFYKTGYRFFLDFDRGYLLSKNGTSVQANDEDIMSIIIDVNTIQSDFKYLGVGMITDKKNKVYIIPALYGKECITHVDETVTEKHYTSIKSVTTGGNNKNKDLNISNSDYNTSKDKYVRIGNDNENKLQNITSTIESNRIIVSINKADLDSTIFTPNKIYTINNYAPYSKKDASGKFILVRKREQYNSEPNRCSQNLFLTFKKVGE